MRTNALTRSYCQFHSTRTHSVLSYHLVKVPSGKKRLKLNQCARDHLTYGLSYIATWLPPAERTGWVRSAVCQPTTIFEITRSRSFVVNVISDLGQMNRYPNFNHARNSSMKIIKYVSIYSMFCVNLNLEDNMFSPYSVDTSSNYFKTSRRLLLRV